jgi:hypothetical protein
MFPVINIPWPPNPSPQALNTRGKPKEIKQLRLQLGGRVKRTYKKRKNKRK